MYTRPTAHEACLFTHLRLSHNCEKKVYELSNVANLCIYEFSINFFCVLNFHFRMEIEIEKLKI